MPKNTHTRIFKNIINNETLVLFVFVVEDCLFRKTELWELFDVVRRLFDVRLTVVGYVFVRRMFVVCPVCAKPNKQWTKTNKYSVDRKQSQKTKTKKKGCPSVSGQKAITKNNDKKG